MAKNGATGQPPRARFLPAELEILTNDRRPPSHPALQGNHRAPHRGLRTRPDRPGFCPGGRSQCRDRAARRRGLRVVRGLRRPGPGARAGTGSCRGAALQPVPHDGHLRSHPGLDADRSKPPHRPHGPNYRGGQWLPGLRLDYSPRGGHRGRGATAERLHHRHVRQGPPHPVMGDRPGRPVRPLAYRPRVRSFLWVPRCRDLAVRTRPVRPDHTDRPLRGARRLPPH